MHFAFGVFAWVFLQGRRRIALLRTNSTGNEWLPYYELTGCNMPEFTNSPIFLIIAAVLAIFIIIGIVKHTARFLIWIAVIVAILILLGVTQVPEIREWFERLPKW